jgi:glycosyltransferase involved in cell wall biosynthesis
MSPDTISIVVLTHDRKRLLRDCLHSLLAQTYPRDKIEIVVSDDGSRDGTRELVEQMQATDGRIKYAYQPHRGIAAARNHGLAHATGAVVAIVADDYILDPTYVSTIMRFFDKRPAARSCASRWSRRGRIWEAASAISTST